MPHFDISSQVEKTFLRKSGFDPIYHPTEKIPSIIVDNFPLLGQFTALRFLEWVQHNPTGVVSLPTGKTPEFFIRFTELYLKNWNNPDTQKELESFGINPSHKPDMSEITFIQIDEFYPISPDQHNSFHYYIQNFYLKAFGLNSSKAHLIDTSKIGLPKGYTLDDVFPDFKVDLSLRTRHAQTRLEQLQKDVIFHVDEFCMSYEDRIRQLGGIGFFLGGIGPDGHIGFNVSGSDFHSTTRLTAINYETAAASAGDLGGIETSRNRPVITIGLETITHNKNATVIIMSAGEAKSHIVADSIECEPTILYPASVLQGFPGARFYITTGSSMSMQERNYIRLKNRKEISSTEVARHLINLSLKTGAPLESLTPLQVENDRFSKLCLEKSGKGIAAAITETVSFMKGNIDNGMGKVKDKVILHTSPHHDDEMLGYMPYLLHLIREVSNSHHFAYLTSGFTSVTNGYILKLLMTLDIFMQGKEFQKLTANGYFSKENPSSKNDDIYHFLDGVAADSEETRSDAVSRRLYRILCEVYQNWSPFAIREKTLELMDYCKSRYPGQKDISEMQKIKGHIREWEAELVWGYFGYDTSSVHHARLGFYTGDIFTAQPTMEEDVKPVLELLEKTKPDIVSVAYDPEGSGPDTHYKVLQSIAEALKLYEKKSGRSDIRIWGYRNVWHKYHPADVNLYIPTSLNSLGALNNMFLNCFGSQKEASFPSFEYDGPFSKLAQKVLVDQYEKVKSCLSEGFFFKNPHPRFRGTRGFVFLKEMGLEEFYAYSRELKKATERSPI